MKVMGIHFSNNTNGQRTSTLHLATDFEEYYRNPSAGRGCEGMKAESVYVGTYDISDISIGDEIEIFYGKAVTTARGTFQPILKIELLNK